MIAPIFWAANLIAVLVLIFGLYFPRHHRRDMIVAFLGLNIGITVVAATLVLTGAGLYLGFGLFGVLSIIRLRGAQMEHREVAYYFATLTLGLLGGLGYALGWISLVGMVLIVATLAIADHPGLLPRFVEQSILLDRAIPDNTALIAHLESLLGGRVYHAEIKKLDLVKKTTLVDVRYCQPTNPVPAAIESGKPNKTRKSAKNLEPVLVG